jgi:cation transporter protein
MSESIFVKIQRRFSLFIYVFSPTHIKDVCISMATTYESKISNPIKKYFSGFSLINLAPKIITIKSYPIALTCRFIQLLIFTYAFGYIMWYKRGYQDRDPSLTSSVTLKVKGIGSYGTDPGIILDNADYVVPPQENNALFIMTNFISTDQKRTFCLEGEDVKDAYCKNDSQCQTKRGYPSKSNGRWTGKCRLPQGRCEMEGWCPVENDLITPEPIIDALNYTLSVNNFVEFTRFNIKRENILNESDYFRKCRYHPIHDQLCPIFRIGDLLDIVETDAEERQKMLQSGAVVRIKIDWMCNLDLGEDKCKPAYSFGRLDSRSRDEQFSFGFNFRYASHWKMDNTYYRTLKKAFGLRLIVTVNGDAGRFDLLVLTLNIGSMIGVLGLATVICDIVVLYFSDQSYIYRRQKFQSVHLRRASVNSTASFPMSNHKRRMSRKRRRIKKSITFPFEGTEC